jgi:Zn-dependent protease with chaperone function
MNTLNYPKSPEEVKSTLTRLSFAYNIKAIGAILSVILFFAFYVALVIACAYLIYWALIYEIYTVNKWTILLKIGAIAGSVMLFIFTLKFIFKLKNHPIHNRIKLDKKEHAEIWEFVYQICKETGAPKPKNIYVDPDVNAYVAYSNMWLSLLFPVRKELTIGLGLVSCLNLSEFKAVISHEFGHFSQRSMTIGSYIITANSIIHDMIFSRDKWDDILQKWQGLDLRLSFAAYALLPMIWVIRQLLNLFYQLLNVLYSSLSREMEFNADKVAVKTSGSEAIVSGLWKLDYGVDAWNTTLNSAYLASQKQMFIKNLYWHNMNRISELSASIKSKLAQLPADDRGGRLFFSSSENSKVSMYASHPANDQREANAKTPYIACEEDERSAWVLFPKAQMIQEELSELIYKLYWDKKPEAFADETQFEAFIKEEQKGESLQEEYQNTFVNRFVTIPTEAVLKDSDENVKDEASLKQELKELMAPVKSLDGHIETLQAIAQGTTKIKEVKYGGVVYKKKNLDRGYQRMMNDREKMLNEEFKDWDRDFFCLHYSIARSQNTVSELMKLYRQHQLIVDFYRKVVNTRAGIFNQLQHLQESEEVSQSQVFKFGADIRQWMGDLNKELGTFNKATFVPLTNIANVDELKLAIIDGGAFTVDEGNIFENGGFDKVAMQLENAPMHCQRIDQKSIGAILQFHQEMKSKVEKQVAENA